MPGKLYCLSSLPLSNHEKILYFLNRFFKTCLAILLERVFSSLVFK